MTVKIVKSGLYYMFLCGLAFLFLFPIIWMVVSSFKPEAMIATDLKTIQALLPPLDIPISQWLDPYKTVFSRFDLIRGIGNSLLYGTIVVTLSILVNSLAAYALAKMNFPGKGVIFSIIILIMIVPMETGIVPLFVIVNRLGIVNTIAGLVAPAIASVFNIFLFRQFFIGIPKSLEEASVIDGAGKIRIFFSIILPLSKPIIATVSILTFIGSWNDFLWPVIIFTDNKRMPLQVILNVLNNTEPVYTNEIMAALTVSTIPIILIYAFFQKYIVEGVAHTGIK
jgi:fructooligosaccharide transport system permease protein